MAGYNGYSMSNNATAAYALGEAPVSKWTKTKILAKIQDLIEVESSQLDLGLIKKLTLPELKDMFLVQSGWHHTSKEFNKTLFYSIDLGDVTNAAISEKIDSRVVDEKAKPDYYFAQCQYGTWQGSQRHPKLVNRTNYFIISGKWAYPIWPFSKKPSKKNVEGNYFSIIEKYKALPPECSPEIVSKIIKVIGG